MKPSTPNFLGQIPSQALLKWRLKHKSHCKVCETQLTYMWCEEYKHSGQGTPAPPWWDAHAGQGRASHGAAQEKGSSEEHRVLEKCQSLTELQCRKWERVCNSTWKTHAKKTKQKWWWLVNTTGAVLSSIPVTGLSRRSTEDGLLMSAKNLYRSSSLSLSPSYRTIQNHTAITIDIKLPQFSPVHRENVCSYA